MVVLLLFGLATPTSGMGAYYASLTYISGALAFFLVRTLKLRIEPEVGQPKVCAASAFP